jgi:oligoribonuclease NrnB/cAMP/cGMP phosphodiesterase (DHH superfamily)
MKQRIILSMAQIDGFKNFTTKLDGNLVGRCFSIIITHIADLDGLFCGLLADKRIECDTIIIPLGNAADKWLITCLNNIMQKGINVDEIYVTDIGLLDDTHEFIGLNFDCYKFYIDHHKSALDQKELLDTLYDEVIIDTKYSATVNCFKRFQNESLTFAIDLERYIKFVNDRDLWLLQYPQSDRLAALYKMFFFYKMFDYICNGEEIMDVNGNISSKYDFVLDLEFERIEDEAKKYISLMKTVVMDGIKFGYGIYNGNYASDITEYFRRNKPDEFTDVEVLVFIFTNAISLRTIEDGGFDVSAFAKARNGGGHVKASGYPLDNHDILIDRFLASLIK